MKQRCLAVITLILGLCPFIVPVALGLYRMQIERWTLTDWLVLYSFIYWPTYLLGLALIALSVFLLCRHRKK